MLQRTPTLQHQEGEREMLLNEPKENLRMGFEAQLVQGCEQENMEHRWLGPSPKVAAITQP